FFTFSFSFLWIRRRRVKNVALPWWDNRQTADNHRPTETELDEKAHFIDKRAWTGRKKSPKTSIYSAAGIPYFCLYMAAHGTSRPARMPRRLLFDLVMGCA